MGMSSPRQDDVDVPIHHPQRRGGREPAAFGETWPVSSEGKKASAT